MRYDTMRGAVFPPPRGVRSIIRGGSPLLSYKDGWLAVVHQVHEPAQYIHRFAVFDYNLTQAWLGEPFFFQRLGGIEFCAGLVEHEGKYLISFGARDSHALVAIVEPQTIEEMTASSRLLTAPKAAPESLEAPIPKEDLVPRMPMLGPPPTARGQQDFLRIPPTGAATASGKPAKKTPPSRKGGAFGLPPTSQWPGQGQGRR
jgi:hypothetical protein